MNLLDRVRIWLKGKRDFCDDSRCLKQIKGRCCFFKDNGKCGIYPVRPKICRKFSILECEEIYKVVKRLHGRFKPRTSN